MGAKRQSAGAAALEILSLLVAWAAVITLVNPRGNFPVLDDWHYSFSTLEFARTGHFHMTRYSAPSLRAQVVWGAFWIRAFGFSFEVLRASTLTLSAATLLLINRVLAATSLSASVRWIACLALLFHPIFLFTSCTFMTEVPFVFMSIAAYAFLAAGIQLDRTALVATGTAVAVLSCFIRQTGALSIAAAGLLLLVFRDRIARRWVTHGLSLTAGVLVLAIVAIFRREWLAGSLGEFRTHYDMWSQSTFGWSERTATAYHYFWFQAVICALFFMPLAAPLLVLIQRSMRRRDAILLGIITTLLVARAFSLTSDGYSLPFSNVRYHSDIAAGQLLNDFGVGPLTLQSSRADINIEPIHLRTGAKALLTFAAAILGSVLIWAFFRWLIAAADEPARNAAALVAASFVLCGSGALILSAYYFDRYSLDSAWALVIVLPLIVPWERRAARIISLVALVACGSFSIAAVHDYFAWNRVRWTAYTSLRSRGLAANQINGGLEITGWEELVRNPRGPKWFDSPRPYAIVFRPPPGTVVVAKFPYYRWLGMWHDQMYAVRQRNDRDLP